eukprot:TRINITY_DN16969_c0_g1_i4.p1 TRINITY_DN16969_c0_g1~~TRINITY_DN16969_c0_g1_i4.p1  ORF type:complete len:320 (+),score=106.64 TRINITY_DN16969_c0_g1_i4:154-1113(+)
MITASMVLSEDMSSKQLVEIGYDLQKQLHFKDALYKKERAVLEQKISLLEMQVRESKEREVSMKSMYEKMIEALNTSAADTTKAKELELITELHSKEVAELKHTQLGAILSLRQEVSDLRLSLAQSELECTELSAARKECVAKLQEVQEVKGKLEERVRELESEGRKGEGSSNEVLEKAREEYGKELSKVKEKYETSLKKIKSIYEKERAVHENKLKKANAIIKSLENKRGNYKSVHSIEDIKSADCRGGKAFHAQIESSDLGNGNLPISTEPKRCQQSNDDLSKKLEEIKYCINKTEASESIIDTKAYDLPSTSPYLR